MSEIHPVPQLPGLGVDGHFNLYTMADDGYAEQLPFSHWPYVSIIIDEGVYSLKSTDVAVATMATAEDREGARSMVAATSPRYPSVSKTNRGVIDAAASLGVTVDVICQIVRIEDEKNPFAQGDLEHYRDKSALWLRDAELTGYAVYPVTKIGDNVYSHVMTFDGSRYSLLANSKNQWAHRGDLVTFAYRVKDQKFRNIIRESFLCESVKGSEVVRGDRSPIKATK